MAVWLSCVVGNSGRELVERLNPITSKANHWLGSRKRETRRDRRTNMKARKGLGI